MVLLKACVFFLEKALYNWLEAQDFGGFFLHIYKEEWFPICGCPGECVLLLESQGLVGIIESLFCVRLLKVFDWLSLTKHHPFNCKRVIDWIWIPFSVHAANEQSDIWNKTNYYMSMMPPELVDCLFIQTLWKLNLIQYYVYFLYFVVLREQAPVWWDCISDFGLISELSWFLYFIHVSLSCRL